MTAEPKDSTHHAGRGVLWITAAKLLFIVAGYSVQLALPRLLGSPASFGLYSTAMNVVSILNNVLIAATIQSVSRQVSANLDAAPQRLRQGLELQALVGAVLAGTVLISAPWLANQVLLDSALQPLLRVASGVIFAYALYASLVGYLNGRHDFQRQARLDMTFTVLRTSGILGAAALGYGALGAVSGFATAAGVLLLVSILLVGTGTRGSSVPWRQWLGFMAPLWVYQACLNGTLQIDLPVLKRTVALLALDDGATSAAAAELASRYAGYYRAAQTFAFVPYQLILAVTFVVFPMVSKAVSLGDQDAARTHIRGAMRFSVLVLLAIAAPISGASSGVMRIAYPAEYVAGSEALTVLALGMVCFALFVIAATALSGGGRPALAASIAASALVAVVAGNRVLVGIVGVGELTLAAAATGTSLGMALAFAAVGTAVYLRFQAFVPAMTALRALLAGFAAFATARWLPHASALSAIGALIGGGLTYLAVLAGTGEIGKDDLALLRRLRG